MPQAISHHVPVKTTWGGSALAWQSIATANFVAGTAIDVSGIFGLSFDIRIARLSGSAFTAGWPTVRIEAKNKSSNGLWTPIFTYTPALGSSIANTTLSSQASSGQATAVVASATNIAAGDILFLGHTTDTTKYELARVKSISGTTVTFEENIVFTHDSGAQVTDQAEMAAPYFRVDGYSSIRAIVDNANSGQSIAVQVLYSTFDKIQTQTTAA